MNQRFLVHSLETAGEPISMFRIGPIMAMSGRWFQNKTEEKERAVDTGSTNSTSHVAHMMKYF